APYDATRVLTHTYRHPGSYVVVVTVRTGRPCSGGRTEVATRRVAIEIAGSSPRPPPSASSSATPRPTPARTGSPSAAPTPAEPSASASPEPTGSPHSGQ
ncbi:MAG TPA: hypothetical protein VNA12_05550, partial [Mycobacteriales bacterium]|nr:hypothetical protein [Mycobacteriales bacterium]